MLDISTPSLTSAPRSREKENWGTWETDKKETDGHTYLNTNTMGRHTYMYLNAHTMDGHTYLNADTWQCLNVYHSWLHREPHNDPSCHSNKVNIEGLRDEGKGAGNAEIALNDLQLVVLGYQLEVEGTYMEVGGRGDM